MCLFCSYVVQNLTAHIDTKALNICHRSQRFFCEIFVGIPQHNKGYLVYFPSIRKIISSNDVVFDETFSTVLAYTSHTYPEALTIRPAVSPIPHATSSHEQTRNIITFS